jgi:hypothetical protein
LQLLSEVVEVINPLKCAFGNKNKPVLPFEETDLLFTVK